MRNLILYIVVLSTFSSADFMRVSGIVTDSSTRLQWQDDYSDNGGEIKESPWIEAIAYCEDLVLDGENDWRLPSINELSSIVDYNRLSPALNPIFQNTESSNYWSSTTNAYYSSDAWVVYFNYGYQSYNNKYSNRYVRCVGAGQ